MSTTDTPRTDGQMESPNESTVPINFARTLEREADAYAKVLHDSLAREDALYKQLTAAQAKIANQSERIRYLEGATNHATGTPLSQAHAKIAALEAIDAARKEGQP